MTGLNKIAHCLRYYDMKSGCNDVPKTNKELAASKRTFALFSKWATDPKRNSVLTGDVIDKIQEILIGQSELKKHFIRKDPESPCMFLQPYRIDGQNSLTHIINSPQLPINNCEERPRSENTTTPTDSSTKFYSAFQEDIKGLETEKSVKILLSRYITILGPLLLTPQAILITSICVTIIFTRKLKPYLNKFTKKFSYLHPRHYLPNSALQALNKVEKLFIKINNISIILIFIGFYRLLPLSAARVVRCACSFRAFILMGLLSANPLYFLEVARNLIILKIFISSIEQEPEIRHWIDNIYENEKANLVKKALQKAISPYTEPSTS